MPIKVVDYEVPFQSHDLYDVIFNGEEIETLVTDRACMVDSWINQTEHVNRCRLHRLIVGLDVEWRPNTKGNCRNPIATLQLCVGKSCLIFQILYARRIPKSLVEFLGDDDYTFVGVGIRNDVEKLFEDYNLEVSNVVELGHLAARELDKRELKRAGLKDLAKEILGEEVEKPRKVAMSRWDQEWLSREQVGYACIDASLSFEIGRRLNSWY